jgi:hypothetical protein
LDHNFFNGYPMSHTYNVAVIGYGSGVTIGASDIKLAATSPARAMRLVMLLMAVGLQSQTCPSMPVRLDNLSGVGRFLGQLSKSVTITGRYEHQFRFGTSQLNLALPPGFILGRKCGLHSGHRHARFELKHSERESVMRALVLGAAIALVGCQKESAPVASTERTAPVAPVAAEDIAAASSVEGWQTDQPPDLKAPEFSLARVGGGMVTHNDLRGRWTIFGFWNATVAGIEEESRFIRALNAAADQDPDLDFLTVYLKLDAADTDVARWFANNGGAWPTLTDNGDAAGLFEVANTPAYLLIGPDLRIEAYRGALSATPDDGIKPVIRGIAQIRKQIASPPG